MKLLQIKQNLFVLFSVIFHRLHAQGIQIMVKNKMI
jgi:hypothetical protein